MCVIHKYILNYIIILFLRGNNDSERVLVQVLYCSLQYLLICVLHSNGEFLKTYGNVFLLSLLKLSDIMQIDSSFYTTMHKFGSLLRYSLVSDPVSKLSSTNELDHHSMIPSILFKIKPQSKLLII